MNHRGFNIRRVIRPPNPHSNISDHDHNQTPTDGADTFKQFFNMFKNFMQNHSQKVSSFHPQRDYQLEPRDREVVIEPPRPNEEGRVDMSQLKWWTTEVVKSTFSSAFNCFSKGDMSFEQAKIYCSENVFKNMVRLSQNYPLSEVELQMMDGHIKNGVLPYLAAKYPLTDSSLANKKLQQIVREVDSIESVSNNYFTTSPIIFELRSNPNYNDLIMQMVNDLISKVDDTEQHSNFQDFEKFMSELFEKVEDQDWVKKKEFGLNSIIQTNQDGQLVQETQQQIRKRIDDRDKYKSSVKEYTHYLIGRKISENTPLYTQNDIKNGNIEIKSPQILRILTKWCEELEEKYKNRYFSNRSESVRVQRGEKVNSLLAWMRKNIDDLLEKEKEIIDNAMKEYYKNNYEMQTSIMQYELARKGDEHIDPIERISGKFSYKIVKNLHQYIIDYLNRLIHGILVVAKKLHATIADSVWPSPPCLLSFKIGDLLRCKCSSKEKEIIRLYEEINRISKDNPEKLKIVRIKNRLKSGTSDILMNIRFNDSILCEIQLAIESKTSAFIKCSNIFHHYLYQLQRSLFGPITELGSIWNSIDKRINIYGQLVEEEQNESQQKVEHECLKLNTAKMVPYMKPFICSSCKRTYCNNRFLKAHLQCKTCSFLICAKCRIEEEDILNLKHLFNDAKQLREASGKKIMRSEVQDKFGICIFIKTKESKPIPYTVISHQNVDYLLKKEQGQISQICTYKSKKQKQHFRNNYLVFEAVKSPTLQPIQHREAMIKFILPLVLREIFKKEKEAINLMDLKLTTDECREILSIGSHYSTNSIKNIFLTDNIIEHLPFTASTFPNIEWLTFSRNKLKSLTGINQFKQIRKLILTNCGLKEVFPQVYDCTSLFDLETCHNQISVIDPKIIEFKSLRLINLHHNQFKEIPECLFECKTLVSLDMHNNYLTEVSEKIENLQNLQILHLYNNRIKKIPEGVGRLRKLKELCIQSNSELAQPISLQETHHLQMLDISSTQINDIICPETGLPKLAEFKINKTKIAQLPPAFQNSNKITNTNLSSLQGFSFENLPCENVKIFACTQNDSPKVAEFIEKMKCLVELTLSTEKIENGSLSLPNPSLLEKVEFIGSTSENIPILHKCSNLTTLKLSSSNLISIPEQVFSSFVNLQTLECQTSSLTYLPKSILALQELTTLKLVSRACSSFFQPGIEETLDQSENYFPKLTKITITKTKLKNIPSFVFQCLALEIISMDQNQFIMVSPEIVKLKKLKEISFYANKITEVPKQITQLPQLAKVNLTANCIACIPHFIQYIPKLVEFVCFSGVYLKKIECIDWILASTNINFGNAKSFAEKMKKQKEQKLKEEEEKKRQQEEEQKKKQEEQRLKEGEEQKKRQQEEEEKQQKEKKQEQPQKV